MPGDSKLSHDKTLQWGAESQCDLVGDRHPSPREAEHHQTGRSRVVTECLAQLAAGIDAILETLAHRRAQYGPRIPAMFAC